MMKNYNTSVLLSLVDELQSKVKIDKKVATIGEGQNIQPKPEEHGSTRIVNQSNISSTINMRKQQDYLSKLSKSNMKRKQKKSKFSFKPYLKSTNYLHSRTSEISTGYKSTMANTSRIQLKSQLIPHSSQNLVVLQKLKNQMTRQSLQQRRSAVMASTSLKTIGQHAQRHRSAIQFLQG